MPQPDLGDLYTSKELIDMERKVARLYEQASKDIQEKLDDFTRKMAAKEKVLLQKVKDGKMTQEEFDHWKAGVAFRGKLWEQKAAQISAVLADTNTVATNLLRDKQIGVFAMNSNYAAYNFEHGAGLSFGFDIYDEKTVARLLADDPNILPFKKLDKKKDIKWNFKNIRSQITQGIVQGESIPKIAQRLADVVPNRNKKQMVLHARTAMTSAQNGGRQERYKEAEKLGIKFKKIWRATLDGRTRDAHRDLDGQKVDPDKDFEVWGYKIRFPGDPWARPELVYNCRCTMITEDVEYPPDAQSRRAYREWTDDNGVKRKESYIIKDMTYREWEKWKQAGGEAR